MKFSNIIHVIPLFIDNTIAINVYNCNSICNTLIFQYISIYFIFYVYVYVFSQIVRNRLYNSRIFTTLQRS